MDVFMQMVQTVGLNVAVIGAAFYFVKYMFDKDREERLNTESAYKATIAELRETIQRNTDALEILSERMR